MVRHSQNFFAKQIMFKIWHVFVQGKKLLLWIFSLTVETKRSIRNYSFNQNSSTWLEISLNVLKLASVSKISQRSINFLKLSTHAGIHSNRFPEGIALKINRFQLLYFKNTFCWLWRRSFVLNYISILDQNVVQIIDMTLYNGTLKT